VKYFSLKGFPQAKNCEKHCIGASFAE